MQKCTFLKKIYAFSLLFKINVVPLHSQLRNNTCCKQKADALVAQLVEHLTLNQRVQGSNPCRRTKVEKRTFLHLFYCHY